MSTTGWSLPDDPLGAFCRDNHAALKGVGQGAARGPRRSRPRTCSTSRARAPASATRTGCARHPPATRTAPAVQALLDAGADMVGQHALRRALLQPDRRERALRHAGQRQCAGPHARRLVERIGRGGGGRARRFCARHRLRRLGAHPRQLLRHHRTAADARARFARGGGAVRAELRRRRLVRARCRHPRDGRPRAAREDRAAAESLRGC